VAELAGVESGTDNFTLMRKGGQRPAGNAREKTAGGPTAVSLGLTGSRLGRRPRSIDTASTWRAPVRVSAFRTLGRRGWGLTVCTTAIGVKLVSESSREKSDSPSQVGRLRCSHRATQAASGNANGGPSALVASRRREGRRSSWPGPGIDQDPAQTGRGPGPS
jgi:hypothetical protein